MKSPETLIPVIDAAGPAEAHVIASLLREEGIEAFVFDTAAQTLQWEAPRIINPYFVHVQRKDAERARAIIRSNREESIDFDWDEISLGEPVDETARKIANQPGLDEPLEPPRSMSGPVFFFVIVPIALALIVLASWAFVRFMMI